MEDAAPALARDDATTVPLFCRNAPVNVFAPESATVPLPLAPSFAQTPPSPAIAPESASDAPPTVLKATGPETPRGSVTACDPASVDHVGMYAPASVSGPVPAKVYGSAESTVTPPTVKAESSVTVAPPACAAVVKAATVELPLAGALPPSQLAPVCQSPPAAFVHVAVAGAEEAATVSFSVLTLPDVSTA